ncbi:hypothetical protein GQ457_01G018640 [Hibiscus cannabinus]
MIIRYCWKIFVLFRFYARNDQPGRKKCNSIGSCTKATWITKAQKLSRQSIGPDFPATAEGQSTGRDINHISIFFNVPIEVRISEKVEIKSKSKT